MNEPSLSFSLSFSLSSSSNAGDRREGHFDLLVLLVDELVLGLAAHDLQAVPHGRVREEVDERPHGVVAQLPEQRGGADVDLKCILMKLSGMSVV